jgi:hypothetical protein
MLGVIKEEAARFPNVAFYDPTIVLCGKAQLVNRLKGEFLYRDATHIRRNLAEATLDQLSRQMGLDATLAPWTAPVE